MVQDALLEWMFENDSDDARFERFCNAIVGDVTGLTVVGTSKTSDAGKDGVTIAGANAAAWCEVSSSVRADFRAKVLADATRLATTSRCPRLFLCSSQNVTEIVRSQVSAEAQAILGQERVVEVLCRAQLKSLSMQFFDTFARHYGSEIEAHRQLLDSATQGDEVADTLALQVAHLVGTDDDLNIRHQIADALVQRVCAMHAGSLTENEVAARVQAKLRLATGLPKPVVLDSLARLEARGFIARDAGGRISVTPSGAEGHAEREREGSESLVARRLALRAALKDRLGFALADDQFEKLWTRLTLALSSALSRYGNRFLALSSALSNGGNLEALRETGSPLIRGACREASSTLSNPQNREEAEEALLQILLDATTGPASWLEHLATTWLAVCSLGLAPEVARHTRRSMQAVVLSLDTDIILSLLCEAERANGPLSAILAHWHAVGGRTLVADEVLSEVAHHAWIARVEYAEVASILARMPYDSGLARTVARNAFVRSFWYSHRERTQGAFEKYIRIYAGANAKDGSAVTATLKRFNIGARIAPPENAEVAALDAVAARAKEVLARTARFSPLDGSAGFIAQDKMNRDSRLIAVSAAMRRREVSSGSNAVLLLTSSKRLQIAVRRSCEAESVFGASSAALASLLAAVPNLSVTPQVVSALLLDEEAGRPVSALRSQLVRLLIRSEMSELLPPARIVSLERQLDLAIVDTARKSARSREAVQKDVVAFRDPNLATELVAKALRAVAIGAEADALIRDLTKSLRP